MLLIRQMEKCSLRLSKDIIPTEYNIRLEPIGTTYNKFRGRCIIGCKIEKKSSNTIILHGCNLDIKNVKLTGAKTVHKHLSTQYDYSHDIEQIILTFDSLPENLGVLKIKYEGPISSALVGFYKCKQNEKIIMLTQFEPISARKCFPCFDEPHFKAVFNLEIMAPTDRLVLSNTAVKSVANIGENTLWIFEPTPLMSTYLVAVYIGYTSDINWIEKLTEAGIRIRIYSNKNSNCSQLAIDTAVKCMNFMTEYFDIGYPLKKLDLLAVPSFASHAMENWGLVIFREEVLISNSVTTSATMYLDIIYTICHELAHQWFGNLVTIEWWSDLWLNESFATWMGVHAVTNIYPELNIDNNFFVTHYIKAFSADALTNSHPVYCDIASASNIMEIFDAVTYQKGSIIIKMLVEYMGNSNFKNCMQQYMKKFAFKTITTNDFCACLEFNTNQPQKNIFNLMNGWIQQKGFPLITVSPYGPNHLQITQSVFTYIDSRREYSRRVDQPVSTWTIPLTADIILDRKKSIIAKSLFQTKINSNGINFYKIHYDPHIFDHIIHNRSTKLYELDIATILSDQYFLLKANKISYDYYLEYLHKILTINKYVTSTVIIDILHSNYRDFNMIIHNEKILQPYTSVLIKYISQMDFAGGSTTFMISKTDTTDTVIYKTNVLQLGCAINNKLHLDYCLRIFNQFVSGYNKGATINPNIISTVLYVGWIQTNDLDFYTNLLHSDLEIIILEILGLTTNQLMYIRVLDLFKTSQLVEQNKVCLFTTAGLNKKLNYLLWPYIRDNWDQISEMFGKSQFNLAKIIMSMKYLIGTPDLINEINRFFASKNKYNMELSYNKMIELISINHHVNKNLNSKE